LAGKGAFTRQTWTYKFQNATATLDVRMVKSFADNAGLWQYLVIVKTIFSKL
jgi:hypothetical protein